MVSQCHQLNFGGFSHLILISKPNTLGPASLSADCGRYSSMAVVLYSVICKIWLLLKIILFYFRVHIHFEKFPVDWVWVLNKKVDEIWSSGKSVSLSMLKLQQSLEKQKYSKNK